MSSRIVIIGAGHAGGSAAAFLRQYGWKDAITLVGEEAHLPYQRPPLSKAWLKGEAAEKDLQLRPEKFYADQNITLKLSTRVNRIDREQNEVVLADGERLSYTHLILSTGARARRLPATGGLSGVHHLRSLDDADNLRSAIEPGSTFIVVGGGYVGLEVAATAQSLGAQAIVIEREQRLLARVASPQLSSFMDDFFRAKGVRIELGTSIDTFESKDGRLTGVHLSDGSVIACQSALIGIGADSNDELMRDAGLTCSNGVIVDETARTSDTNIFAIGDCTFRPLPLYDQAGRLESVPNALEQAKQAASAICGRPAPTPEVPWFWSDQFDLRLQMAGLRFDITDSVIRGDVSASRFAIFHLDAECRVRAVEAINAPAEFMAGKMLIGKAQTIVRERLQNPDLSMQEIAA
jgi:3-phenylpropionate/trans-cinnamate dioxygenase ferredoxin reductase subunit